MTLRITRVFFIEWNFGLNPIDVFETFFVREWHTGFSNKLKPMKWSWRRINRAKLYEILAFVGTWCLDELPCNPHNFLFVYNELLRPIMISVAINFVYPTKANSIGGRVATMISRMWLLIILHSAASLPWLLRPDTDPTICNGLLWHLIFILSYV